MNYTADEKIIWDNTIDIITNRDQETINKHFDNMDVRTNKIIMRLAIKSNASHMIQRLLTQETPHVTYGCRVAARYNYPILKILLLSDINYINKRILKIKSNITKHRLLATILNDNDIIKVLSNKTMALLCLEYHDIEFTNVIDVVYGCKKNRDSVFLRILQNQNLTKDQAEVIIKKIHREYGCMSVKVCREACLTIMDFKIGKNDWKMIQDFIEKKPGIENAYFAAKLEIIKNESKIIVSEEIKRFIIELSDHLAIIDDGEKFNINDVEVTFRRFGQI
jgi:hypothetical protein